MTRRYIHTFDDRSPEGYHEESFTTNELERVGRRFTYHPERHNSMFYEAVAETLRDGKYVPFPLGEERHEMPNGIAFRFEHVDCIALLPEPMGTDTTVTICTRHEVEDLKAVRIAHVFADHFVTEYKGHYSHAIAISKEKNNIS